MSQAQTFCYPSCDGVHSIHACQWLPQGPPRAVVQIVHGGAEHIRRYSLVAQFLTGQGFAVCGEDHLGHGATAQDGRYGFFAPQGGWDLVSRDICALRQRQGAAFPGVPYFLLGHSMGSFLTRTYLIRWPGTVDGAILSGTGQEPAPLVAAGRVLASLERLRLGPEGVSPLVDALSLGAYNRRFRPNRTRADWISRDTAQVDAYLADPLCTFQPTVSMFYDMMGGLQFIANRDNLARMDPHTPIYLFSGDRDPVGGMGKGVKKVYALLRRAGCEDVTLKLYPGGRHEMFHELNHQQVFQDTLAWLESKL